MRVATKYKIALVGDIIMITLVVSTLAIILVTDSGLLDWLILGCCAVIFLLTLMVSLYYTVIFRKEVRREMAVMAHFRIYRRNSLGRASRSLNIPKDELVAILMKLKGEGMLNGRFEESTGEFIMDRDSGSVLQDGALRCSACGGYNTKRILMGDTLVCQFCGSPLHGVGPRECPGCGSSMTHDEKARMWICGNCGRGCT